MTVLSVGATSETEVQKKIRELLENTETKCIGDFKINTPCKTKPFDAIQITKFHLPEWFLNRCRWEADKRDLIFEWANPTSGKVIKIKEIRNSRFFTRHNPGRGFHLGVEITWHEDDQEYVDMDEETNSIREAVQRYTDLLDEEEKYYLEENAMSKYEEKSDSIEDQGTVYFQMGVQKELLAQLDSVIEVLGNRVYTVLADEKPQLVVEDSSKEAEVFPELVTNLELHNRRLTGYLLRLNGIVERVRL